MAKIQQLTFNDDNIYPITTGEAVFINNTALTTILDNLEPGSKEPDISLTLINNWTLAYSWGDHHPTEKVNIDIPTLDNCIYNLGTLNELHLVAPDNNSLGVVIYFTSGASGCVISYPINTYWIGEESPQCKPNKKYIITILDKIFKIDTYTEQI